MKKLYLLLLLSAIAIIAKAQNTTVVPGGSVSTIPQFRVDSLHRLDSLRHVFAIFPGLGNNEITTYTQFNHDVGRATAAAIAASAPTTTGTISSAPVNGDTWASLNGFIALWAKTNNPTGGLSGGTNYQRSATGVTHNLSYSYGRTNLNTNAIASAVINPGSLNVFSSSPTQGNTTSGTQSITTAANTNKTYTITITTTDSKTASYSTSDLWFGNAYYGRAVGASATGTEVLASAGGASPLTAQHNGTWTVTASGSNYPFIATPTVLGHITVFTLTNGTPITSLFAETTVSITNASGYTENFYVYTMNTPQSGNLTFVTN